jgi:hypothetical protein
MAADDPRKGKRETQGSASGRARPARHRMRRLEMEPYVRYRTPGALCLPGKLLALLGQITAEVRCTVPQQINPEDADEIPASF